jgi:hypothetical protein
MKFLSVTALTALLALGAAVSPRVMDHGAGDAIAVALAGGIFTIALAVYIRD